MKVDGVGPKINITERREQQSLPSRIEGRLMLDQSGQPMLRTQAGELLSVRLMGIDLPLGQQMTFELIGKEGATLIYSAGANIQEMPRFESLLKSWGMEPDASWRDVMTALYQEGLPLTKDNVLALERNLRLIRQEWGFLIKPKVLAMMMAKNIPVQPQTVLATLFRAVPELRQEIAKAIGLQLAEVDTQTMETIEKTLQGIKEQIHLLDSQDPNQAWQAALGTVVCRTDDQGEIHWPAEESSKDEKEFSEKFGFELIPPHIGLVEVGVHWSPEGSKVTLTVEADYLEMFQKAIPAWQRSLCEHGIFITASAKATNKSMEDLPPMVDWRA